MKSFSLWIVGAALVAATLGVAVAHGKLSRRWGTPPDVEAAAKRLERLPTQIGDWQIKGSDQKLDERVAQMLQCNGTINRVYENTKTGDKVRVFVVLGPAGPIAVHTPEICYSSKDYKIDAPRQRWAVDDANTLWDLRLKSNDISDTPLRVVYGWTNDTHWQATDSPRFAFGGRPMLYKIQLAGPVPASEERDACREFLSAFLPVLKKHLTDAS
jgi:hypothetical protein